MRLATLSLLALALFACDSGSDDDNGGACTTIGCVDGYTLDFSAASWPQGKYRVELDVDGTAGVCEATLPLTASSQSTCTLPGVQLGLSGSALPEAQHALVGLTWASRPTKIGVKVLVDGAALGQPATFLPTYVTSQPNGPSCGPTCTNARDQLKL